MQLGGSPSVQFGNFAENSLPSRNLGVLKGLKFPIQTDHWDRMNNSLGLSSVCRVVVSTSSPEKPVTEVLFSIMSFYSRVFHAKTSECFSLRPEINVTVYLHYL